VPPYLTGNRAPRCSRSRPVHRCAWRQCGADARNAGTEAIAPVRGYGVAAPRGWGAHDGGRARRSSSCRQRPGFEAVTSVLKGAAWRGTRGISSRSRGAGVGARDHEDAAATLQVASGDALPAFVLAPPKPSSLQFTGWLRGDAASDLLARAGLDLVSLKQRARQPSFRAFAIEGATVSAAGDVKTTDVVSHTCLRGSRDHRPDSSALRCTRDATATVRRQGRPDPQWRGRRHRYAEVPRSLALRRRSLRTVFAAWTARKGPAAPKPTRQTGCRGRLRVTSTRMSYCPRRDVELIGRAAPNSSCGSRGRRGSGCVTLPNRIRGRYRPTTSARKRWRARHRIPRRLRSSTANRGRQRGPQCAISPDDR
jgi:hypothetical protein